MQGALWVQLTQSLIPNDKINDGAYFATELTLPYGSWCNPDYDKVSTTLSWHFLIPAFTGMIRSLARAYFARGYVEEISASYPMTGNICQGGGMNHYGVEGAFTNFEMSSEGTGALYVKDGEHTTAAMWNPEGDMGEVETWELLEPLLYLGRSIKPMTSGAGKRRGGAGLEAVRMLYRTDSQILFNGLADGFTFGSAGIFGGYPGNSGYRHSLHGTDIADIIAAKKPYPTRDGDPEHSDVDNLVQARETVFDNHATAGPQEFGEHDLYVSVHRGGPGLGDPLERDPAERAGRPRQRRPAAALRRDDLRRGGQRGRWRGGTDSLDRRREGHRGPAQGDPAGAVEQGGPGVGVPGRRARAGDRRLDSSSPSSTCTQLDAAVGAVAREVRVLLEPARGLRVLARGRTPRRASP